MIRESWLVPIAADAPCGPDLGYDADFLALETAARGKPEQQYGDTIIPAEEPVWNDVVERAEALLDRTRDLRVVSLYARALTHTQGLAGAAAGLRLARDLLGHFWEPLHPTLVIDGDPDPLMRMNALGSLAAADGMVRDIRTAEFLRTPSIALTVREVESILDRTAAAPASGVGVEGLRATIGEILAADPKALAEAPAIVETVNAIRSTLLAYLEPSVLPDFAPLTELLKPIAALVEELRAIATAAPSEGAGEAAPGAPAASGAAPAAPGEIRTREDAIRVLDRVCDYLGRHEPTNPAPLLIRRAQRLMTMPFIDIIRDLAPDAMGQVQTITGARSEG